MHNCPHGRNALVGGDPGNKAMGPEDSEASGCLALRYALTAGESSNAGAWPHLWSFSHAFTASVSRCAPLPLL